MTTIKEKDFVEVEYTGKITEDNHIFDTTDEKIAKENDIYNPSMTYGPLGICIGEGALIKGLEDQLVGKEIGKEYEIKLECEQAFGKKSSKMLKIVPTNTFKKEQINPAPGMQVNIDGMLGVIKTVTGGRTIVDFNHPLSGKDITYKIKATKIITDDAEKIKNYIALQLNIKPDFFTIKIENEEAQIQFKEGLSLERLNMENLTKKLKEFTKVKKFNYIETKPAPEKEQK